MNENKVILGTCCHCFEDQPMNGMVFCADCGGMCCNEDCLAEHECDPDGDMD